MSPARPSRRLFISWLLFHSLSTSFEDYQRERQPAPPKKNFTAPPDDGRLVKVSDWWGSEKFERPLDPTAFNAGDGALRQSVIQSGPAPDRCFI